MGDDAITQRQGDQIFREDCCGDVGTTGAPALLIGREMKAVHPTNPRSPEWAGVDDLRQAAAPPDRCAMMSLALIGVCVCVGEPLRQPVIRI